MAEPIPVTSEDAQRRIELADVWNRYDGNHPDSLADETLVSDNVTLNDLATIVDTGVDFLTGTGQGEIQFGVMHGDDEDEAATAWLDDVLKRNRKPTMLRVLGMSGAIAGHFALKIVPARKPDGVTVDPKGMHRVIVLDPLEFIVQNDPDDIDRVTGYAIDKNIVDTHGSVVGRRREQHTLDDGGMSWTIRHLVTSSPLDMTGERIEWTADPQRPDPIAWPHPFAAIIDGQNLPMPHRRWGRPDLTNDILHLNEALNRVASNEQKTLRHFAHPVPYAVAGEAGDPTTLAGFIDASIGSMICLPSGASMNTLRVQHEGLGAASAFRDDLTDKLFEIARTPRLAAGKIDGIGALSGVALLILYRPLLAKTETKRDTYGDALRELCARLLALAAFIENVHDVDVVVTWPDALPRDMGTEVVTARDLRDLGVSLQTVLERLGFNYEQEKERIDEEASDPMGDAHGLLSKVDELAARLDAAQNPQSSPTSADPSGEVPQTPTAGA